MFDLKILKALLFVICSNLHYKSQEGRVEKLKIFVQFYRIIEQYDP